jgi:multiple sugar transport system permease protein
MSRFSPRVLPRVSLRAWLSYRAQLWLLLLPFLLGTLILILLPMVVTLLLGLTQYDLFSPPEWNNFANYINWLTDRLFQRALYNSLWFIVIAVPLRVAGALLLALALNRRGRGFGLARASVYVPAIVPEVAYAMVWLLILNPGYGIVNLGLQALGLPGVPWLTIPFTARASVVVMWLFQLGEGFILMLAALQILPPDVLECATVDGANRLQRFRHIILPLMLPALLLLTFRDVATSFQSVFLTGVITTQNGPYYTTYFLSHYVFDEAFGLFRYGYASATTSLIYIVTVAIVAGQWLASRRWNRLEDLD